MPEAIDNEDLISAAESAPPFDVQLACLLTKTSIAEGTKWFRWEGANDSVAYVVEMDEEVAILHWIESRRMGEGSRLMRSVFQWARKRNLVMTALVTDETTIRWYERHGWQRGLAMFGGVEMRIDLTTNP